MWRYFCRLFLEVHISKMIVLRCRQAANFRTKKFMKVQLKVSKQTCKWIFYKKLSEVRISKLKMSEKWFWNNKMTSFVEDSLMSYIMFVLTDCDLNLNLFLLVFTKVTSFLLKQKVSRKRLLSFCLFRLISFSSSLHILELLCWSNETGFKLFIFTKFEDKALTERRRPHEIHDVILSLNSSLI